MNTKDHQRGPNVHFYRVGIGSKKTVNALGWQLMSLNELTRKYNDTNVRILLQIMILTISPVSDAVQRVVGLHVVRLSYACSFAVLKCRNMSSSLFCILLLRINDMQRLNVRSKAQLTGASLV